MSGLQEKIDFLHKYSACDVSDALNELEGPRGGYLADIVPFAPKSPLFGTLDEQPKIIAPAMTVKYVPKDYKGPLAEGKSAIPPGGHYVDLIEAGTVVVMEQPEGQHCAVLGGIMAARMKYLNAKGVVVGGRVRDLAELRESGLPIWALAKSTVGTNAESKIFGVNLPVSIKGVEVKPGDIIFCDPLEGVVRIPKNLLDDLITLLPKLIEADDKVKDDVLKGGSVAKAFKEHRGGK